MPSCIILWHTPPLVEQLNVEVEVESTLFLLRAVLVFEGLIIDMLLKS